MVLCGNCVFYTMWHWFPPINSWVVIIPAWLVVLSALRTFSTTAFWAIPPLYVAVPLVLAVYLFAPGMIGPPLGFWIPICCIVGTLAGIFKAKSRSIRSTVLVLTGCVLTALFAFGTYDWVAYHRMPAAERAQFTPVWRHERYLKQPEN